MSHTNHGRYNIYILEEHLLNEGSCYYHEGSSYNDERIKRVAEAHGKDPKNVRQHVKFLNRKKRKELEEQRARESERQTPSYISVLTNSRQDLTPFQQQVEQTQPVQDESHVSNRLEKRHKKKIQRKIRNMERTLEDLRKGGTCSRNTSWQEKINNLISKIEVLNSEKEELGSKNQELTSKYIKLYHENKNKDLLRARQLKNQKTFIVTHINDYIEQLNIIEKQIEEIGRPDI